MNKPISKHALRRAMDKVSDDGLIQVTEPIGTVVDKIWHEIERSTYNGDRKKAPPRVAVRQVVEKSPDVDLT